LCFWYCKKWCITNELRVLIWHSRLPLYLGAPVISNKMTLYNSKTNDRHMKCISSSLSPLLPALCLVLPGGVQQ
jgi:hypothetical protein